MKIFLLGKIGSITGWVEDCAAGLRHAGHAVRTGPTRNPALHPALEAALRDPRLGAPAARILTRAIAHFSPDLILALGAFQIPGDLMARISTLAGRPPVAAWVGDAFDAADRVAASHFDLVAYTDSGLLARHRELAFSPPAIYLPHAVDPASASTPIVRPREPRMVFVANPTPHRREVVAAVSDPLTLYGRGWRGAGGPHQIHARRVARRALGGLYASHVAALNIRHEANVLDGLNQRSFAPCLSATAVVSDNQPDLERCFEPGREVLVWRDVDELNAIHGRLRRDRAWAADVGERGRRRVLADHTYGRRLESLAAALGAG